MAFNIREFFKGLRISQENTLTPKQIDIIPGGAADTTTTLTTSQTIDVTITLPNDTTTLLGTATIQNVSNKTITDSTIDSTSIGQTIPAAVSTTSLVATTADINAGTIDNTIIGATTPAAATFTTMTAPTVDIDGGAIDNTSIGATTPSSGSFTTLDIAGDSVVTEDAAQTLKNKSLEDTTTAITDFADPTIRIKFDAAGTTATSTTLLGSQTVDRILTLPDATDTLVARNTVDTLTNKTLTTPTITNPDIDGGSLDGTVIGANTPAAADFTTVDTTGDLNVGGNTVITGNLTVNGTTTTLNTQTLDVEDANISVNILGNDASAEGAGLTVNRTSTDGSLIYKDLSPTKFAAGPLGSEDNLVGQTVTQTLSNKALVDATTTIIDSVDATKTIKFDAAGTTGTSTTLLSSQTTNKTLTLPDATDTLVGKNTTDLLTNKTLQFVQEAVATNAALAGASQTLNTITTGIVRLTNASLTSLAGISAGASGQNLKIENKTGTTISIFNENGSASASDRILTGTAATVELKADATLIFIYDTTSSRWHLAGGSGSGTGSGSGGVNFIPTGDAESTNPFIGYQYFSTTRPTASGSPAVTGVAASISLTDPLADGASFLITKTSGANAQGLAVDIPFTVDPAYRAKANTIEFDYMLVSGTFQVGSSTQDSDLIVYIRDVDNDVAIEPSNFKFLSNSTTNSEKFSAQFQTSSNSENYRLTFYTATTNTPNYSMKVDNIKVGPSQYVYGTPVTDWRSVTPTGSWTTNSTYTGRKRRVGDSYEYEMAVSLSGAPNAAQLFFNLPTSDSLDVTKYNQPNNSVVGVCSINDSGTLYEGNAIILTPVAAAIIYPYYDGGTSIVGVTQAAPVSFGSGDSVKISFSLPILGLSSSVQMSDNADTRVVDFVGAVTVGTALTANVTNIPLVADKDSHGAWSLTTYTVQVSGDYQVAANLQLTASASTSIIAYVNGVATARVGTSYASSIVAGSPALLHNLRAGDTITFRSQVSVTTLASTTEKVWIERISGPASILAVETTAISYSSTNGPAIGTGATAIAFNVRDYDTHGNQYVGSTFTALASGKYRVSARYLTTAVTLTTAQRIDIFIYKNGAMYSGQQQYGNGATNISYTAQLMDTISLNAGDTLKIYGQSSVATSVSTAAGYSRVCIERIGL